MLTCSFWNSNFYYVDSVKNDPLNTIWMGVKLEETGSEYDEAKRTLLKRGIPIKQTFDINFQSSGQIKWQFSQDQIIRIFKIQIVSKS